MVGLGAKSFAVEAWPGQRVRLGDAQLEVVSLVGLSMRYRWIVKPSRGSARSALRKVRSSKGRLRLREMGFYRLRDGTVIGVGNVLQAAQPKVSITVFPKGYDRNPIEYDQHIRRASGSTLEGTVGRWRLRRVVAGEAGGRGFVELSS